MTTLLLPSYCEQTASQISVNRKGARILLKMKTRTIKDYLTLLNECKATNPDKIHNRVLKELANEIAKRY